jgi:CelD/BcsL family acetyltransferase involved in cellulose biosynthesis
MRMRSESVLEVPPAQDAEAQAWDDFVEGHAEGRFSQLWGFRKVFEETYGYRCLYLKILLNGRLAGVFPAVAVRSGSPRLVSLPFHEYGGPLVQGLSAEDCDLLVPQLLKAARQEGCRSVEIRGGAGCQALGGCAGVQEHRLHSYATLPLQDPDWLWRKALNSEARKAVNRARQGGLSAQVRRGSAAIEDPFYQLYLVSMKRLGVPPHSLRFFTELVSALGERVVAASVSLKSETVAVLLGAVVGSRVQIYVTASSPLGWHLRPNDLAHWELITWACREGLRTFDFGSARYPGQIHFKRKWGCEFHPYSYYLMGDAADTVRIHTVDSSSTLMRWSANVWRWTVPIAVTRILGPPLRKYLTK